MYNLGQYKIYNWSEMMKISSSKVRATINKYIATDNYSIDDIDRFISEIVDVVNAMNMKNIKAEEPVSFESVIQPLKTLDEKMSKRHQEIINKSKIEFVRDILLPRYENNKYVEYYKAVNTSSRPIILQTL